MRGVRDDILLAETLSDLLGGRPEIERVAQALSFIAFRFVPRDLRECGDREPVRRYLDRLNRELVARLDSSGGLRFSAVYVDGRIALRAAIVTGRITVAELRAVPEIVSRLGRATDTELRPGSGLPCEPFYSASSRAFARTRSGEAKPSSKLP